MTGDSSDDGEQDSIDCREDSNNEHVPIEIDCESSEDSCSDSDMDSECLENGNIHGYGTDEDSDSTQFEEDLGGNDDAQGI